MMDGKSGERCLGKEAETKISGDKFIFVLPDVESDDVFEVDDVTTSLPPPPPPPHHHHDHHQRQYHKNSSPGEVTRLYEDITDMAMRMSHNIVISSLPSSSPQDVTVETTIGSAIESNIGLALSSSDVQQDRRETSKMCDSRRDDDDDHEEEEVNRNRSSNCRDTLEDWESETSESGSYVIGSSEHVSHPSVKVSQVSDVTDDIEDTLGCILLENTAVDHHHHHYSEGGLSNGSNNNRYQIDNRSGYATKDADRHKMAVKRLIELISSSEPFPNLPQSKIQRIKSETKKQDVADDATWKPKVEQWNFRFDRLLNEIKKTNKHFFRNFCRGQNFDDSQGDDVEEEKTPLVEFNPGMHCTDASQAHNILTTRYKLGDIKKKRSLISWSKWNVGHIVRGPHSQSPIWKPGFLEEAEKSRNVMAELNKSIESREISLQKLADNQTIDYYTGLVMRCFERQQSNPNLRKNKQFETTLKAQTNDLPMIVDKKAQTARDEGLEARSNSLSMLTATPHQPQHSNHIKCFVLNDTNRGYETLPISTNSKPSIVDFLKQTNQTHHATKPKSTSISSKVSDEGYDDDVFSRDEGSQEKHSQCLPKSIYHRSQPLLHYFHNSQSLQTVSQQHRNKMKKKSQQRQRQIKSKLEASFPREKIDIPTTSSQYNTPMQQTRNSRQTLNCMTNQSEHRFSSLRINKKSTDLKSCVPCSTQTPRDQVSPVKGDGTSVFSKFYQWFHGKVSG